jgi:hypothetical protein
MSLILHYNFENSNPNLLTKSQSIWNYTSDAYGFASFSLGTGFLKNNTTYTLTICGRTNYEANKNSYLRTYVYDAAWSYQTWSVAIESQTDSITTLTFTTGSSATSYNYCIASYHFPSGSAGQGNTSTVKWYKLEEGSVSTAFTGASQMRLADNSGNNRHATVTNCNISKDVVVGNMSLDTGASGYAQLPSFTLPSAFTICGWVKFVDAFATWARVFDFGSAAGGGDYAIGLATNSATGNLCVFGRTGGGAALPDTTLSFSAALNTWYHYAIVLNGTNLKVYWDGALVAEWTIAKSLAATYTLNYLGKSNWSDPYSRKYMSDFRVYDEALSGVDIYHLMKDRAAMEPDISLCSHAFGEKKNGVVQNNIEINSNGLVTIGEFIEDDNCEVVEDVNYDTLDYIQSTGSQWINTGIHSGQNITRIDAEYHRNTTDGQQILFGMYTGSGTGYSYLGYTEGGADELFYWYGAGVGVGSFTKGRKKISLSTRGTSVRYVFNGTPYSFTTNAISGSTNYYLFGDNSAGTFIYGSKVNLYKFKIWVDNKLVRNFIPARRKSDGVVGLYDAVYKTFYINSGAGTFTAGHVVSSLSNFTKLEYIQSSGSQYIDTGVYYNSKLSFAVDFSNFTSDSGYVLGIDTPLFGLCRREAGQIGWFSKPNQMFTYNSFTTSGRYYIECSGDNFSCNLVTYDPQTDSGNAEGSGSFRLFNGRWALVSPVACRLHSCRIYDDGELIRDFIPVKRNSDGVVGLYEVVTNAFYTNNGSGSFTAGTSLTNGVEITPAEYEDLLYIEANGSQQLDTGVRFNMETDGCMVDYASTVLSQSGMILASNNATNYFWFYHYAGTSAFSVYISANAQVNVGNLGWDTRRHKMTFKNKTYSIDGAYLGRDTRSLPSTDYPLYLCSWNNAYYYSGRIYGCKIWRKKGLIRDFVPVRRKSDGAIGLYDRVHRKLYTGSGNFIAGPSLGTKYIVKTNRLKENL